jgi:membrane-associated phospholipid phosphatase
LAFGGTAFQSSAVAWLHSLDVSLFRAINLGLSNGFLDWLMPIFAWNAFFVPAVIVLGIVLLCKGGRRGRIFVLLLAIILALGDSFVINTIKHALARPRPFHEITDAHLLVGYGQSASMPSSHTSTWFAAMLIACVFYRRTIWVMLPLALIVAFSRVYVGAHYPSDVIAGAILGMGYASAGLVLAQLLWRRFGPVLVPEWSAGSLARLDSGLPAIGEQACPQPLSDQSYLRLGYLLIAVVLVGRLIYLASGIIELSEDEAYQWLWSKHLALSYYSKPPIIAYAQFLGTALWGDSEFGVRFLSPVVAAILSFVLLRFFARHATAHAGFWLVLILNCTPMLAVGGTLLTIDPLLVLFWTCAMIAGWSALQPQGRTSQWAWTGVWLGLGFLSKYTAALQILCFAIYFCIRPETRVQLRRPGPYLALVVFVLCTIPVLVWNAQHDWITLEHVASNAKRVDTWKPLRSFLEFLGAEFALLNPIFFVGVIWALLAFRKNPGRTVLWDYFFCMGAPVFIGYAAFALYKRAFPNWIAVAVVPLFCLMVLYWQERLAYGWWWPKRGLIVGFGIGALAVILLHNTDLTKKLINRTLPGQADPLRRVRGWSQIAKAVSADQAKLLAEGKPVFVITDHYGMAGELSFYMPDARSAVKSGDALVYFKTSTHPKNQFYFWPGYREVRRGQNAVFVKEADLPRLIPGWWWKWLLGETQLYRNIPLAPEPPAPEVLEEFESVTSLSVHDIEYKGRVIRRIQVFACRNLR